MVYSAIKYSAVQGWRGQLEAEHSVTRIGRWNLQCSAVYSVVYCVVLGFAQCSAVQCIF